MQHSFAIVMDSLSPSTPVLLLVVVVGLSLSLVALMLAWLALTTSTISSLAFVASLVLIYPIQVMLQNVPSTLACGAACAVILAAAAAEYVCHQSAPMTNAAVAGALCCAGVAALVTASAYLCLYYGQRLCASMRPGYVARDCAFIQAWALRWRVAVASDDVVRQLALLREKGKHFVNRHVHGEIRYLFGRRVLWLDQPSFGLLEAPSVEYFRWSWALANSELSGNIFSIDHAIMQYIDRVYIEYLSLYQFRIAIEFIPGNPYTVNDYICKTYSWRDFSKGCATPKPIYVVGNLGEELNWEQTQPDGERVELCNIWYSLVLDEAVPLQYTTQAEARRRDSSLQFHHTATKSPSYDKTLGTYSRDFEKMSFFDFFNLDEDHRPFSFLTTDMAFSSNINNLLFSCDRVCAGVMLQLVVDGMLENGAVEPTSWALVNVTRPPTKRYTHLYSEGVPFPNLPESDDD